MSNLKNSDPYRRTSPSFKLLAVIGLLIAFFWPLVLHISGLRPLNLADSRSDLINVGIEWLIAIILVIIAFGLQRYSLAEFGMKRFVWRDVLFAFVGTIVGLVLSGIVTRVVALPPSLTNAADVGAVPVAIRLALVLTAGLTEEFMFRGFGIEELAMFVKNRWLAGFISLLLFTLGHIGLYGFSPALFVPFAQGLVLTVLYLWRRNLWSCILMHALIDGLFLVVVPALVHPH